MTFPTESEQASSSPPLEAEAVAEEGVSSPLNDSSAQAGEAYGDEEALTKGDETDEKERPNPWDRIPLPGDDDFDENNAHVRLVINEWAGGTSIHGVASIADFMTWAVWKRLLWAVLVCAAAGLMIWQITSLVQEYKSYDVVTDTETSVPESLEFPEITVCNLNSYSQFRINETGIFDPINETELFAISPPLDDFILFSSFNTGDQFLNQSEVWKPQLTDFGLCWSFSTDAVVRRPGLFGGLEFGVWLDQEDFDSSSEIAGILVYAEQPGTPINDQLPFAIVSPGKESVITIRKEQFSREREAPWARCKGEAPSYSQPRCRHECRYTEVRNQCGCREKGDTSDPSMPFCVFYNQSNNDCLGKIFESENEIFAKCSCSLPPCEQTTYSLNALQADHSEVFYESLDLGYFGPDVDADTYQRNFIGCIINYGLLQENKSQLCFALAAAIVWLPSLEWIGRT